MNIPYKIASKQVQFEFQNLIKELHYADWDVCFVTANINITEEFILQTPYFHWNKESMKFNPNLSEEFIENYKYESSFKYADEIYYSEMEKKQQNTLKRKYQNLEILYLQFPIHYKYLKLQNIKIKPVIGLVLQ